MTVPRFAVLRMLLAGPCLMARPAAAGSCQGLPIFNQAPPLGTEHQVDDLAAPTSYDVYEPQAAADNTGRVAHVWLEAIFANPSSHRIQCKSSFDHGATITAQAARVDSTPAPFGFSDVRIALDNAGGAFAIWKRNLTFTAQVEIWFSRSLDGGLSWEPDRRIDHAPPGVGITSAPEIAAGDGHVYVAWSDTRESNRWRVFLQHSADSGASWAARDVRVDRNQTTSTRSEHPRLAIDGGGHVYVVWEDNRQSANSIWFNASSDHGQSFMAQDIHVDSLPPGSAYLVEGPVICAGRPGDVYIAWRDLRNGAYEAWFNHSADFGASFAGDGRIDHGPSGIHTDPLRLAADAAGGVYGAWTYAAPGPQINVSKLWLNRSLDGGSTWGPSDVRLDAAPANHHAHYARLRADASGNVFAAWVQEVFCSPSCVNAQDVYCIASTDRAATFEPPLRLDGAPPNTNQGLPELAAGGCGIVQCSWRDNRNLPGAGDPLINLYTRAFAVFPCPGDVDGDGAAGILDLLALLAAWGPGAGPADIDGDGAVGILDFLALLAAWGPCG